MSELSKLREGFAQPPEDSSIAPFWFWNGDLAPAELIRQLEMMRAEDVYHVMIHARRGLEVPYLSDDWLERVRVTVERAAALGMKVWLYDEDNWPSGYAGGRATEGYPEGRAKNLGRRVLQPGESYQAPENTRLVAAAAYSETEGRIDPFSLEVVTEAVRAGDMPSDGRMVAVFERGFTDWNPAYSKEWYVDLMDPEVVCRFIQSTHARYEKVIGEYFGSTVLGFFTDEPGFYNNFYGRNPETIPWCEDFLAEFARRRGRSLEPLLPLLWQESTTDAAAQARQDYYGVLGEVYTERFFGAMREWCEARGLQLTGHVNNEEYIFDHARYSGDFFRCMEQLNVPGMDLINGRLSFRRNSDSIVPKIASSAAHILGKSEVISETYGAFGWDLPASEMKSVADWQYVRGITRLVPHAFYYSIEGDRKRECPPSLFWQSPHWPYAGLLHRYQARWTYLLTRGQPVPRAAVLYPIAGVRSVLRPVAGLKPGGAVENPGAMGEIDRQFRASCDLLLRRHLDFDIVDDPAIAGAAVFGGLLCIQKQEYQVVLLPPTPSIPVATLERLLEFVQEGGILVTVGAPRVSCDTGEESRFAELCAALFPPTLKERRIGKGLVHRVSVVTDAVESAVRRAGPDICLTPDSSHVTCLRLRTPEAELFVIVNEQGLPYRGSMTLSASGIPEWWSLEDGSSTPAPAYRREGNRISLPLDLAPWETIVLALVAGEDQPHVLLSEPGAVTVTRCALDTDGKSVVAEGALAAGDAPRTLLVAAGGKHAIVEIPSLAVGSSLSLEQGWSLTLEGETQPDALQGWQIRAPHFSGIGEYTCDLELPADWPAERMWLRTPSQRDITEVLVNGKSAGARLWHPYRFDITNLLRPGRNQVTVRVTNTLANEIEQRPVPSGLFAPVLLTAERRWQARVPLV